MTPKTKTERLTVAGVETHLVRAGAGEPLILLHGLGASSYSWRFAVPELARRHEVFAPDVPGFGRSDKPWDFDYSLAGLTRWLVAFMDRLGLAKARFAGNSMGGVITLFAAMEAPDRVERMALLGVPAFPEHRPRFLWPLSWPVVGPLYEGLLGEWALRRCLRETFVDQSKITEELVAEYLAPLKERAGRRAVAQFIRRAIPPDFRERIARYSGLRQPALVLIGEQDGMVGLAGGERLSKALPRAVLRAIPGCGHAPQEDAPERVVPILAEFFASAA